MFCFKDMFFDKKGFTT